MNVDLDILVEDEAWRTACPNLESVAAAAFGAAAKAAAQSGGVSLMLTDDAAIRALNLKWRGKDKPTDILSFPADEQDRPFLGDIALAYGVCATDAAEKQIPLDQHLSHLFIHGYLHLLGHDHMDETQATEMEALEIRALASLGWPDPYKY